MPILSELYWLLLQPSTLLLMLLVLVLLLLVLRSYTLARALLVVALALTLLPAILPVRDVLAVPLEQHHPLRPLPERVDGIVVLGGAVEWRVTEARGQLALSEAAERMVAAAALAERYPEATLVLTGIFGETLQHEFRPTPGPHSFFSGSEYRTRRPVFVGAARSTYEDALFALEAAEPGPGETWILVTSALHMPRAVGVFETIGWRVVPYPVDFTTTGRIELRPTLEVIPALVALDKVVREWGALVIYALTGRTQSLLPETR